MDKIVGSIMGNESSTQSMINSLLAGLKAAGTIGPILLITMYLYAVVGASIFSKNDPDRFENFHRAFLTLFECSTFESLDGAIRTNFYGCNYYEPQRVGKNGLVALCVHRAQPLTTVTYFCSFVFLVGLVILSGFLGAVQIALEKEMTDALRTNRSNQQLQDFTHYQLRNAPNDKAKERMRGKLKLLSEIFDLLDVTRDGQLTSSEVWLCKDVWHSFTRKFFEQQKGAHKTFSARFVDESNWHATLQKFVGDMNESGSNGQLTKHQFVMFMHKVVSDGDSNDQALEAQGFPDVLGPFGVATTEDRLKVSCEGRRYTVDKEPSLLEHWKGPEGSIISGHLSSKAPITMADEMRSKLLIPVTASSFAFLFPTEGAEDLTDELKVSMANRGARYSILVFGGYIYFDKADNVVCTSAIVAPDESCANLIEFFEPKPLLRYSQTGALSKRLEEWTTNPVTISHLRKEGVQHFCWCPPGAIMSESEVAANRTTLTGCYPKHDPTAIEQVDATLDTHVPAEAKLKEKLKEKHGKGPIVEHGAFAYLFNADKTPHDRDCYFELKSATSNDDKSVYESSLVQLFIGWQSVLGSPKGSKRRRRGLPFDEETARQEQQVPLDALEGELSVLWSVGDRVKITKEGTFCGEEGVIDDTNWSGRVKVRMDGSTAIKSYLATELALVTDFSHLEGTPVPSAIARSWIEIAAGVVGGGKSSQGN
jgi:hypothetical protein